MTASVPVLLVAGKLRAAVWRKHGNEEIREVFRELYDRLQTDRGRQPRDASMGLTALWGLLEQLPGAGGARGDVHDPGRLQGAEPGDVSVAWGALLGSGALASAPPRRVLGVRKSLSEALMLLRPELAVVVNPLLREMRADFRALRSHERVFSVHGCLPKRVRLLSEGSADYQFLVRLVEGLSMHMVSVSRDSLLKVTCWLDHFFGVSEGGTAWWPSDCGATLQGRTRFLSERSAMQWLQRYSDVTASKSIGFHLFSRHMRVLSLLHGKVLHECDDALVQIPRPRMGGRIHGRLVEDLTSASATSDDGAGAGERMRLEMYRIRGLMGEIRERVCRDLERGGEVGVLHCFSADEVYRILDAAVSRMDRLLVVLFLTTGLRIGGLSRLKVVCGGAGSDEVPDHASTVEKNGDVRVIKLTNALRVLVKRWLMERGASPSDYLFPSPTDRGRPISRHAVYDACRCLFRRAGVQGPHAHPHSFRHTVVRLLHFRGKTFDQVAKWLGHKSPNVTAQVYGRLTVEETTRLMDDEDGQGGGGHDKRLWSEVHDRIKNPYPDDGAVEAAAAGAVAPPHQKKRRLTAPMAPMAGGGGDLKDVFQSLQAQLDAIRGRLG